MDELNSLRKKLSESEMKLKRLKRINRGLWVFTILTILSVIIDVLLR
jgi:hypothetical protein